MAVMITEAANMEVVAAGIDIIPTVTNCAFDLLK